MIHGPSLGIGAAIASLALIAAFFGLGVVGHEPELVIEQASPAQAPDMVTTETFLANGSPFLGDPDAMVTLVEFGDYQCQACSRFFHNTKDALLEKYVNTGQVRMVFKDFNIIGPDSVTASHGAHCANEQGLFWEYHDILYENWTGENNGWASAENLAGFARDVGLDVQRWSECVETGRYSHSILASNNDARNLLKLTGTPAFFVVGPGDKIAQIPGAQPFSVFEKTIDAHLEQ
ncbi:MAG: protein-disulfide isomerase [Nitrosopumilus sp. H8]|nr:MAG: protein-disulfide isomerase [Nitrosopumilus sp. H8]